MKWILSLVFFFAGSAAFACVDISGTYSMNDTFVIRYQQTACQTLTETYCSELSKCDGTSHSWLLDGVIRQEGGNPHNWAGILPVGDSLKRQQLWSSGTVKDGQSCEWSELYYSLDAQKNLNVKLMLECSDGRGGKKSIPHTETWQRLTSNPS